MPQKYLLSRKASSMKIVIISFCASRKDILRHIEAGTLICEYYSDVGKFGHVKKTPEESKLTCFKVGDARV